MNTSGKQVDNGDGRVNSSGPKLLEVSLPLLSPGTYRVIWSVVDRGHGHRNNGKYTFIIKRTN